MMSAFFFHSQGFNVEHLRGNRKNADLPRVDSSTSVTYIMSSSFIYIQPFHRLCVCLPSPHHAVVIRLPTKQYYSWPCVMNSPSFTSHIWQKYDTFCKFGNIWLSHRHCTRWHLLLRHPLLRQPCPERFNWLKLFNYKWNFPLRVLAVSAFLWYPI